MTPRIHALYRGADGRVWLTRHYDDDYETFTDARGVVWTRVALTEREYTSKTAAASEFEVRGLLRPEEVWQ